MSTTIAALIRDVDTGRDRGVRLDIDGGRLRLVLASATGSTQEAGVDITEHAGAILTALQRKDDDECES